MVWEVETGINPVSPTRFVPCMARNPPVPGNQKWRGCAVEGIPAGVKPIRTHGILIKIQWAGGKQENPDRRVGVFVELEGIEPSSKQGTYKLSTCLDCY